MKLQCLFCSCFKMIIVFSSPKFTQSFMALKASYAKSWQTVWALPLRVLPGTGAGLGEPAYGTCSNRRFLSWRSPPGPGSHRKTLAYPAVATGSQSPSSCGPLDKHTPTHRQKTALLKKMCALADSAGKCIAVQPHKSHEMLSWIPNGLSRTSALLL